MGLCRKGMGDQEKADSHFQRIRQEIGVLWKKDPKNADTAFGLAGVLSIRSERKRHVMGPQRFGASSKHPTRRQHSLAKSLCSDVNLTGTWVRSDFGPAWRLFYPKLRVHFMSETAP